MNENDGSYNHCNTVTRARVFSVTWFYEPFWTETRFRTEKPDSSNRNDLSSSVTYMMARDSKSYTCKDLLSTLLRGSTNVLLKHWVFAIVYNQLD